MGDEDAAEIVYDIQFPEKLEHWVDRHPEFEMPVLKWRVELRDDPCAQQREHYESEHRCAFGYPVPHAPLVVVVLVEECPDEDGITWLRILKLVDDFDESR